MVCCRFCRAIESAMILSPGSCNARYMFCRKGYCVPGAAVNCDTTRGGRGRRFASEAGEAASAQPANGTARSVDDVNAAQARIRRMELAPRGILYMQFSPQNTFSAILMSI